MENYEDPDGSLPFIDDSITDDEIKNNYYNLKIIENYQNKNRNIEITNESPDDIMGQSLSPVAPLAEETEISDSRLSDSPEEEKCRHVRRKPVLKKSGMKLVVKGWNSTISIQGLDNKSSITFKRKNEKIQHEKIVRSFVRKEKEKENEPLPQMEKQVLDKPRKGRWKMLTKSLISKSSKFDRRGLDERYPKYVLLKNEEEIVGSEKESYPKMVVLGGNKSGEKENFENKSEFNFKRSFKNKTKPIVPIEEILSKSGKEDSKKVIKGKEKIPLTERSHSENRNVMFKKRVIVERRKSFTAPPQIKKKTGSDQEKIFERSQPPQAQVFKEIKDIFEDTLKLCPDKQPGEEKRQEYQPQCCQFSYHDPCCYTSLHDHQPPMYVPVYPPHAKPRHFYKNSNTQTSEGEFGMTNDRPSEGNGEGELSFQTLPFSLLSNFFPRVVIMKTFGEGNLGGEEVEAENSREQNTGKDAAVCGVDDDAEDKIKTPSTLEVPEQDLSIKSKMVIDESNFEPEVDPFFTGDIYVNCLTLNGMCSSDEEQKPKTDDSEATEYLNYCESEIPGNESTKPTFTWENENNATKTADSKTEEKEDSDENSKNFTLTKVGYKMYDNLTKLSLKRETEIVEKPETSGCGCTGNGTKKSPYNITLQSNNGVVKVTVPENELNLKFINSGLADIQIGVANGGPLEKKVVKKSELWHPDNGQRQLVVAKGSKMDVVEATKGPQKISLSLGDNKDVVLSIEMEGKEQKEDKIKERLTKEVKVGTDDFDLAGGDFSSSLGGNYKNLSPRTAQLLKNLQQRLEFGEKERKFLEHKINEKLTDHKFKAGILPGIFLVKQISPRTNITNKKPLTTSSLKKVEKVDEANKLREYYCEECLATMRIFEDENPSVKSIVDKFETIIKLESF